MRSIEKIRLWIFWTFDYIKGRAIRKHLNEIRISLANKNSAETQRINEKYLIQLIEHATTNCSYYSDLKGKKHLSDFPVINKQTIKDSTGSFLAKDNNLRKINSVTTSGSTGTPFETFQDKKKKNRNLADTMYFAEIAGYKIGHRLIYLKIWVESRMRSKLVYWIQNIVPVDVVRFNISQIESLIRRMEKDSSRFGILGYASALELICQYLDRKNSLPIRSKVKSIIAMSETLNEYTRTAMEKYFGVPVVSRYSNLENGIIAQQEVNNSKRFLINTASYHVEVLKLKSDEPAELGEIGRIVVTDLFNYAMPMIRYDTGDIGALEKDLKNDSRKFFQKIEGRKLDSLFDTSGNLISSYVVYKNMWQYTEIDQYQLVQESAKQYTFRINTNQPFTKEDQLIAEFKAYLGLDADFTIEYVSEIPLLDSGKRKKIVNNFLSK